MKTFALPDLGEGLQEAEVISWHVSVGDRVVADQPLLSVETDKAVVDVPAPWSGTVLKLHARRGTMVATGAPLADIDTEDDQDDAGAIVGELPTPAAPEEDSEPRPSAPRSARIKAVPAARQLARALGVELSRIVGTGPGGTITREDVELAQATAGKWEPLRGVRRAMALNMTQAHAEVATTSVTDEALLQNWPPNERVTMRLVRAMIAACKQVPALNAWYDSRRVARLVHSKIDIGMAMNTEEGLFVPVLRDIGGRQRDEIQRDFEQLKMGVINRSVAPQELRNATITLSNFGMVGGRHAVLVIMPPQVAILGAGRITQEPRIVDGRIRPCPILPLSLTFDHRAVTGIEATRFLMSAIADLEN
jgi:2-oxoisovalerate dehydrogenase E2 component (dihydrolipoyl transacylase)